jgi:hypothetical protein
MISGQHRCANQSRVQQSKMPRNKKSKLARKPEAAERPDEPSALAPDDRVLSSNLTLHELFQQQSARMLERADLSEEQKQAILIGMSCPCCGAGGFSFTAKLKTGK